MILEFKKESSNPVGYFGGSPWVENIAEWPSCPSTEKPMVHLFTILPQMIGSGFDYEEAISVFISTDLDKNGVPKLSLLNKYTVQETTDLKKLEGFSRVLKHRKCAGPLQAQHGGISLPFRYLEKRPYTKEESEEELTLFEDTNMGLDFSKFMGIPFYEQDVINPHIKYVFMIQINEWDITSFAPEFKGLFNGGIGYLFLDRNYKKIKPGNEVGIFFVQYS